MAGEKSLASWENSASFRGGGAGVRLGLQNLAVSFCVMTSVDTVNSAIGVAARGEASLLASPVGLML